MRVRSPEGDHSRPTDTAVLSRSCLNLMTHVLESDGLSLTTRLNRVVLAAVAAERVHSAVDRAWRDFPRPLNRDEVSRISFGPQRRLSLERLATENSLSRCEAPTRVRRRSYRGIGFRECGRLTRQVVLDGKEDDEVLMELFV